MGIEVVCCVVLDCGLRSCGLVNSSIGFAHLEVSGIGANRTIALSGDMFVRDAVLNVTRLGQSLVMITPKT